MPNITGRLTLQRGGVMQITIHDDPTRSVVLHALWNHAADAVEEERFRDDLYDCAWERINPIFGSWHLMGAALGYLCGADRAHGWLCGVGVGCGDAGGGDAPGAAFRVSQRDNPLDCLDGRVGGGGSGCGSRVGAA